MSVVDFVIGGAQKGGTTALDAYLREHPEVCMARKNAAYFSAAHPEISSAGQKEVHFFDNEAQFANGTPDYSHYHRWFAPGAAHRVLGEATPIYMYWNEAPRRIREYNPQMKFILVLRDPIERAYSHWNMERIRNADTLSFWDAITNETERCREALPLQHRVYSYVSRGLYTEQLRRIWAHFPRDRVLCLKSESLKEGLQDTLARVCEFLQVSRLQDVAAITAHSLPYESRLTDRERDYLRRIFEPDVRKLEQELDWDCSDWL
jgi:Sulfotransferase family